MKLLKVVTASTVVALTSFALASAFAEDTTATPARHNPSSNGPRIEHILPPPVVEGLALTAEQKTTYDGLDAAFKKDAAKWQADNPIDTEAMKKARETGDKEAMRQFREKYQGLMDIRKSYVDKVRASLTDEQKAKLDKGLADMRAKQPRGTKSGGTKPPTPPPAE